jgi:hypothetical protein
MLRHREDAHDGELLLRRPRQVALDIGGTPGRELLQQPERRDAPPSPDTAVLGVELRTGDLEVEG